MLANAGGARTYAFETSGPRHGDPSCRGRICTRSVGARRCLEQKTRSWEFWKLGGLDKHCAEDLREQAERSATSSTLAVVQAACNTMTPVAPGLQQSSEANAVVAAINGALAPRLGGIQGPMGMLAGQMTSLKCNVVQLSAQAQHHDQGTSECERQLKDTTAGRSTGSGAASSDASSETHPELARGSGTVHPQKSKHSATGGRLCPRHGEGCDLRQVERDIRTRARRQRLVDSGEGRIGGKGQLPH